MVRSEAVGPARAPLQQFIVIGNIERKEREGPGKNERRDQSLINQGISFLKHPHFLKKKKETPSSPALITKQQLLM